MGLIWFDMILHGFICFITLVYYLQRMLWTQKNVTSQKKIDFYCSQLPVKLLVFFWWCKCCSLFGATGLWHYMDYELRILTGMHIQVFFGAEHLETQSNCLAVIWCSLQQGLKQQPKGGTSARPLRVWNLGMRVGFDVHPTLDPWLKIHTNPIIPCISGEIPYNCRCRPKRLLF